VLLTILISLFTSVPNAPYLASRMARLLQMTPMHACLHHQAQVTLLPDRLSHMQLEAPSLHNGVHEAASHQLLLPLDSLIMQTHPQDVIHVQYRPPLATGTHKATEIADAHLELFGLSMCGAVSVQPSDGCASGPGHRSGVARTTRAIIAQSAPRHSPVFDAGPDDRMWHWGTRATGGKSAALGVAAPAPASVAGSSGGAPGPAQAAPIADAPAVGTAQAPSKQPAAGSSAAPAAAKSEALTAAPGPRIAALPSQGPSKGTDQRHESGLPESPADQGRAAAKRSSPDAGTSADATARTTLVLPGACQILQKAFCKLALVLS
jgi:hypothetical protein